MGVSRRSFVKSLSVWALTASWPAPLSYAKPLAEFTSVSLSQKPITHFNISKPDQKEFANLLFLGGLEFSSSHRQLGGISGATISPSGDHLLCVTDNGHWVKAGIKQNATGKPLALENVYIAPMLSPTRKALPGTPLSDIEAITLAPQPGQQRLLVSYETANGILSYPYPLDLTKKPQKITLPNEIRQLRTNKGLEALAIAPNQSKFRNHVIAIAERGRSLKVNRPGFILSLNGKLTARFEIDRLGDFDITDITFLPSGDMLLLERLFNFQQGLKMRIRKIKPYEITNGAVIKGSVLLEADMGHQIDNMEVITAHKGIRGETILTLMSDDNRNFLQRNLLLRFSLSDSKN
ncbi:esterase-like activity of phytase family protein [Flexibacterium corallicola]|uniref:esterase-like activity of phytase family protein n=1 Tax=Flexibacterium corallicola TaxID=3037259 RepID=UPI00286F4184|nr:esterase-like activity of phytase family protein [Pseudovibrio sp. M1P-2-3]